MLDEVFRRHLITKPKEVNYVNNKSYKIKYIYEEIYIIW